jgi:hypothetical protein
MYHWIKSDRDDDGDDDSEQQQPREGTPSYNDWPGRMLKKKKKGVNAVIEENAYFDDGDLSEVKASATTEE